MENPNPKASEAGPIARPPNANPGPKGLRADNLSI